MPELQKIELEMDLCCGGGHCGPLPGYFYLCPLCKRDTQARTGEVLQIGQTLQCMFCKGRIRAMERHNELCFSFEVPASSL